MGPGFVDPGASDIAMMYFGGTCLEASVRGSPAHVTAGTAVRRCRSYPSTMWAFSRLVAVLYPRRASSVMAADDPPVGAGFADFVGVWSGDGRECRFGHVDAFPFFESVFG